MHVSPVLPTDRREQIARRRLGTNLCFPATCAISFEYGIAKFDRTDLDFKRSLIDLSAETELLCTSAKLETVVDDMVVEHDATASIVPALRGVAMAVRATDVPCG